MATYKVIQDIEAEDKLIGTLTFRQLIYAITVFGLGFAAFRLALISLVLAIPLLPPMILFGVLAAPFGQQQPSEVWLLAKIRFALKPRQRIWDQNGMKELVTITAPKQVERVLTDSLSQTEVRSRLQALANTLDSRGWAVKNVNTNLYSQPNYGSYQTSSERLIDIPNFVQEAPSYDTQSVRDVFDNASNPTAQHFTQMIATSEQSRRQNLIDNLKRPVPAPKTDKQPATDYWFMHQQSPPKDPGYAVFDGAQTVTPHSAPTRGGTGSPAQSSGADEQAALEKIRSKKSNPALGHMHRIKPLNDQRASAQKTSRQKPQPPVTATPEPDILGLANNNDLSIDTIARQANKTKDRPDDEVVVSLH